MILEGPTEYVWPSGTTVLACFLKPSGPEVLPAVDRQGVGQIGVRSQIIWNGQGRTDFSSKLPSFERKGRSGV